jgi:ankyrin repeat protein
MKWLLKQGLKANVDDVTLRNGADETPLHCAAGAGHVDVVKLLIKEGCDVTATDLEGNTVLRACLVGGKHCERLCEMLIAAGSDVDDDVLPDTG